MPKKKRTTLWQKVNAPLINFFGPLSQKASDWMEPEKSTWAPDWLMNIVNKGVEIDKKLLPVVGEFIDDISNPVNAALIAAGFGEGALIKKYKKLYNTGKQAQQAFLDAKITGNAKLATELGKEAQSLNRAQNKRQLAIEALRLAQQGTGAAIGANAISQGQYANAIPAFFLMGANERLPNFEAPRLNPNIRFFGGEKGHLVDIKNRTPMRVEKTNWPGSTPQHMHLWDTLTSEQKRQVPKLVKPVYKNQVIDITGGYEYGKSNIPDLKVEEIPNINTQGIPDIETDINAAINLSKPNQARANLENLETRAVESGGRTFGWNPSGVTESGNKSKTAPTFQPNTERLYESKPPLTDVKQAKGPAPRQNANPNENEFKPLYEQWVWDRNAASASGAMKRDEFRDLDGLGLKGVTEYQRYLGSGTKNVPAEIGRDLDYEDRLDLLEQGLQKYKDYLNKGAQIQNIDPQLRQRFDAIKQYFDEMHKFLTQDKDFEMHYKNAYLPQLWKESRAEINKKLGKRLTRTPGFTLESVIENYEEGIKKGLTPVYKTLGELLGSYERTAQKAIADRTFFNAMKERGWLRQEKADSYGWQNLERFPRIIVKEGKKTTISRWQAPDVIAKHINNYLNEPSSLIKNAADVVSWTKNLSLSSGIPGTPLNVHGYNIARRNAISNPTGMLRGAAEAAKDLFTPGGFLKKQKMELFRANKDDLIEAVKNGYTVQGIEDHATLGTGEAKNISDKLLNSKNTAFKILGKGMNLQKTYFEDPLFEGMLPKEKFKYYLRERDNLIKNGLNRQEAIRIAAKNANTFFGGMDTESKLLSGRPYFLNSSGRDLTNAARVGLLAPDWLYSNINLAKNELGALANPTIANQPFRRAALRTGILRGGAAAGSLLAGKSLLSKNPEVPVPNPLDDMSTKTSTGRERSIPVYGTAAELPRLFEQAIFDPNAPLDIPKNRISIPAKGLVNAIMKVDDFGNPIRGETKYGRKIPLWKGFANTLAEFPLKPVLPPYIASAYDYGMGRSSLEEAISKGFELPFQYRFPPKKVRKTTGNNFNFNFDFNPF